MENRVSYYKLFSFADRRDISLMVVGTIGAVASGLATPLMTLLFGYLVHSFGSVDHSRVVDEVGKVALHLVYLALGSGVAAFLQVSCWMITGERQATRIRRLYLQAILTQDIAFFDTQTSSREVVNRMTNDTSLIQNAIGEKVGKVIQIISTFIGGLVIAFARGWRLSVVILACLPVVIFGSSFIYLLMSKMATREEAAYVEAGTIVDQTIGSIKTVASFTAEKIAIQKYTEKIQNAYAASIRQSLIVGFAGGIVTFINFSTFGLGVWYGAKLIATKGYNGGVVVSVISSIMTAGMSLGQTSPCLSAFAAGQAAAYNMFETINRKPEIDMNETSGTILEDLSGEIELKEVDFRYPARPEVKIFTKFSLKVQSGTTAALVGQSGSGKSTVISLLQRFYDPDSGEVLLDGIDIKRLNLKWVREQMGLVSQEPILFMTSIKENIAYGKENSTDEEVRTAVKLADAAEFIDKLPQGLDTMVGGHDSQLSGGQKQRIAIARAILKNPKVLLLDEATSALDVQMEHVVQKALINIMCNRTTVVIAHRLATIRNADLIAVVQQGEVIEQGTHAELIALGGTYSQVVRRQEGINKNQYENTTEPENVNTGGDDEITSEASTRQIKPPPRPFCSIASSQPLGSRGIQTEFEGEKEISDIAAKKERHKKVSILRLFALNKPEIPYLLLGTFAAGIHGVIYPTLGLLQSKAVKIYYEPHQKLVRDSSFWALIYVALGAIALIVSPLEAYLFGIAGGKLVRRIRSMTFERVVHQDISWFDNPNNSRGAVGARLSGDASTVKTLVGEVLDEGAWSILAVISALVIAFTANWKMTLVILAVLPFICSEGFFKQKFTKGFTKDAKVMYEEASNVANDAVSNIRTVASFCGEKKVMKMYDKYCELPMKLGVRKGLVSGVGYGFSLFALYCANATGLYIGARLLQHGEATFDEVFRVFFALTISGSVLSQGMASNPDINKAKESIASIIEILDRNPDIDSSSNAGITLKNLEGSIQFKDVSFNYPSRPCFQVFSKLCLEIPAGKTVALIGGSGCGKSTVISLIERFYDPKSGHISLDGVDIKTLKLNWLRRKIGLVSQEPILFKDTIRTNIAYGTEGATEDEIIAAAKAANAHDFICTLPQGYGTGVGEGGVQLSGGQKQRVAIARAVVKNPRILLLDEATSALDPDSEQVVQDALDKVMFDRTSVVVAHRLRTIKGADVIVAIKDGAVEEEGTHDDLKKKRGTYAKFLALNSS